MQMRIIVLLVTIFLFPFHSPGRCDGMDNLRGEYFMAVLVGDVPYLLCNNRDRLFRLQAELLKEPDPSGQYENIHLNRGYSDNYRDKYSCIMSSTAYEISGSGYPYEEVIGLTGGDKLIVQKAAMGGSGPAIEVTVDKILFLTDGHDSFILVKCRPIMETDKSIFSFGSSFVDTYGYYQHGPGMKRTTASSEAKLEVPVSIKAFVDGLAADYFSDKNTFENDNSYIETVPVRYVDDRGRENICYLAVMSYGEKGKTGTMLLLDKDKQVLQEIHKDYSGIIGLLNPDGGRSHLVALAYGDRYGGGVELLAFDRGTGLLQTKIRICTVFD